MAEFKLFDAPGAEVAEIVTDGETFKPFVSAVGRVCDEARIHIDGAGLSVMAIDPANVFMGRITLDAGAFAGYDVKTESTIGVDIDRLAKLVRRARTRSDDELTLSVQQRELTATVARGYDNHNVVSHGTMQLFDPDSIRQTADLPELDHDAEIHIPDGPFVDALSYGIGASDHVEMAVKGVNQHANALYIGGETDTREEAVAIDNIDAETTAGATFADDYMASLLGGVQDADPESVTVHLSEDYPVFVGAESDDGVFCVEYIVAPRVSE